MTVRKTTKTQESASLFWGLGGWVLDSLRYILVER